MKMFIKISEIILLILFLLAASCVITYSIAYEDGERIGREKASAVYFENSQVVDEIRAISHTSDMTKALAYFIHEHEDLQSKDSQLAFWYYFSERLPETVSELVSSGITAYDNADVILEKCCRYNFPSDINFAFEWLSETIDNYYGIDIEKIVEKAVDKAITDNLTGSWFIEYDGN